MLDQFIIVLVMSLISCIAGWYLGAYCQRRVDDREKAKFLELHRIELEDAFNSQALSSRDPSTERQDRIGDMVAANNHCVELILDELKGLDAMLRESSAELEKVHGFRNRIMESAISTHSRPDWLGRSIRPSAESTASTIMNLLSLIDKLEKQSVCVRNIAAEVNLLAVNAGLEASCTGKAGRGFSVFADCIRRLSGSCAETIMDIYDLVDKIRNGIETIGQDAAGQNQLENDLTTLEQLTTQCAYNLTSSSRTIRIIENKIQALPDSLSNGLATIFDERTFTDRDTEFQLPPAISR